MTVRRTLVLLLLCFVASIASAASPNVVISQVYGGGGATSGTPAYTNDYVELLNTSSAAVPIGGWSLQYGSSTGNFASTTTNLYVFPAGTSIGAGKYLLVKLGTAGIGGTFTGDLTTGGLNMAAGSGKVVLANVNGALGCGATATPCVNDARIVDLVSYGASNNAEGNAPVNNGTGLTSSQGAIRKSAGCQDTDNNAADFLVATTSTGLVPRTSASSTASCTVAVNQPPSIGATANPIATANQGAAPFTVSVSGSDDNNVFAWSANPGTGVASVSVSGGQGTANATFTVTLQSSYAGTASFIVSLSDNVNAAVLRTVNVAVTAATPNQAPSISAFANPVATVAQDAAPFAVNVSGFDDNAVYNWNATPGTGVASVAVSAGQGTPNATYTVTLQAGFSGTAAFTATLSDNVNAAATHPVTITVTPAPPAPLDHIVISQVYGGGGNAGAPLRNDFVELYNPTMTSQDLAGWTIQYGAATNTTWQAYPLGGVIAPGEYFLIALASGGANGAALPAANINGEINMSGTAGKVALVRNGDPLSGCVISDANLVDLVGYGTTANCREGATNAPAPSNTTALFRKNGGWTDTNVNGSDFQTGAPNPRRTAPIVEIGPSALSSDPRNAATTAPRDASITITFTEAVTVDAGWFHIQCATTGLHNDATVASGGTNSWIITPNANFVAGETCTVTIAKTHVHDADLDDALPNTDTLASNYTFTFSVATGAAPSYPADVHLVFGNPTNAAADVNQPNNFLMEKPEFALSYNRDRGIPNWVSWHLANEWIGSLARVDTFRPDPAVPAEWYRVLHTDYFSSGFDRGHMVPNADRDPETSMPINQATFLMTNMIPQAPDNNQGPWANMENYLRTLLPANEVYIVAGGAGDGGTGSAGFAMTLANGKIAVPAVTWKAALVLPKDAGNDVARVTAGARTIAVIMPNSQGIRNNDWLSYLVSIDQIESLTGYDLFANVSDAVENAIEAGVNGANPPGVTNRSVSATEDTAETFTLDAANPGSGVLTYAIVSGPSHGTLSGAGTTWAYTPSSDFNGTDSFTFKASDGTRTSNTATVTITVSEVNDAPVASNDARETNEDAALQFAASELTANDTTGAANEADQTLTVSSVTSATNGTVALSNGAITFTPAANFHGAASFSYEVCDNGTTRGLTSAQCATATVAINVAAINDAPTASMTAPSTGVEGSAISASVAVADVDANDTASIAWTVTKNGAAYAGGDGVSISFTPDDNGAYAIHSVVTDGSGATASASATVNVTNAAPSITSVSGPTTSLSLGTAATVSVTSVDAGSADTHTATFTWNDGTTSTAVCVNGACSASRTYTAAGIYSVAILVSDDDGAVATATFDSVIVTDANAGFVTGGGFVETSAGKATFTANAKYLKNQSKPTGNTKIELAGVTFQSTSLEWLVVTGTTARYHGTGTINGAGNYAFTATATDGATDSFHIRIVDKTNGVVVYENDATTVRGNITIHF